MKRGGFMGHLEEKYNLISQSPMERVMSNPTADNLRRIPKSSQTYELLLKVCAHDGEALKYASKKLITSELCEIAVKQNGSALNYVPTSLIEMNRELYSDDRWIKNLYEVAVETYGRSLRIIPKEYVNKDMVIKAILSEKNTERELYTYPIDYIPGKFKTHEIYVISVSHTPYSIKCINEKRKDYAELAKLAVEHNGKAIRCINEEYLTKELYYASIKNDSMAIKYIPEKYITKEISETCLNDNYESFPYIPSKYVTEEMCLYIIRNGFFSVFKESFPREHYSDPTHYYISFKQFPNAMRENKKIIDEIIKYDFENAELLEIWNDKAKDISRENKEDERLINLRGERICPLKRQTLLFVKEKIKEIKEITNQNTELIQISPADDESIKNYLPEIPTCYSLDSLQNKKMTVHDLSDSDYASKKIYYIFDIHIEHQLYQSYSKIVAKGRLNKSDANDLLINLIDKKITKMIGDNESRDGILLVGGDVSCDIRVSEIFYDCLCKKWKGTIISILGNHELWDGYGSINCNDVRKKIRNVDEVVESYRQMTTMIDETNWGSSLFFLENEVYIRYKNQRHLKISQEDLMQSSENDLKELFSNCSLIILGGIGFSGCNPQYNASRGLYRKTLDLEEDKRRTKIFRRIHDKVAKCAKDKNVIVCTHTPVFDWMPEKNCVSNWIYINGHTHKNSFCRNENQSVILADNQVGYKPQNWKLKAVQVNSWYDPFEKYIDGIYVISSEQYKEFYYGRGVYIKGCNYQGTLYMLKKCNVYMFILESKSSTCLMVGGQRKKLSHNDIFYYYDNMDAYIYKLRELIKPYQNALENISKEVKMFGGTGVIHGCIVDISYYSHIYLNPYDGKITAYWATSMSGRFAYPSVKKLLTMHEPDLVKKYQLSSDRKLLTVLAESDNSEQLDFFRVPEWVGGTSMYRDSGMMRSIQYAWQHNIIRIWNEKVFDGDVNTVKRIESNQEIECSVESNNSEIINENDNITYVTREQYYSSKREENKSTKRNKVNKSVGRSKVMKNGKLATIVDFISRWDITVKFEDGHTVEHNTIWEFEAGNIE